MIYLDNSATTQPCEACVRAMTELLTDCWGNPSSVHAPGIAAHPRQRQAREQVASALGAEPDRVFFTSGGTEADNWAIFSAAERLGKRGHHIVTTAVEHHAVLNCCQQLEQEGWEVTTILPDQNGDVLARAGIIKTKVPLKGVKQPEKLAKEKKPQTKAQQRYSRLTGDANRPNGRVERVQRTAKMECNLLGLTVDEALPEVDSFIDRAILNGQTVVYLIHGNGTGALRTAIHKHLRGNRMVKSFRLGRYGEGESGVTVVELK